MSDARFVRDYRREIPGGYEIVYEYRYGKHIIGVEFIDPVPNYLPPSSRIYYYYDSGKLDMYQIGDIVSIPTMYRETGARAIVRSVVQHADTAKDKRITLLLRK